jgi:hypothetical protein
MPLVPKTLGLPIELLDEANALAENWQTGATKRPDHVTSWGQLTYADVVREALRAFLVKPTNRPKAPKKKKRGARR